jgi:glycosyltransferase involved in cell wall biosynthesis
MERLLVNQVRFGDRGRFDYSVAYVVREKDQLVPELEELGVPVHCLAQDGRPWPVALRSLLVRPGFDVVHVHSPLVASATRVAARSLRASRPRLVYTEHNSWDAYRTPTRWANRLTFALDDAQIAVSNDALASVRGVPGARPAVIDHGIDLDAVRAHAAARAGARARMGAGDDDVLIGIVANFRPEKNYEGLLRSATTVLSECPGARFVSIGQGPLLEDVRRLHGELELGDRFLLMGHQPDAPSLMAGFDVFVLASHWEGLPLAFMEARALGLPVVVTAVGGLTDHVVDGVDGVLVAPRDPDALAGALVRLVRDAEVRERLATASAASADTFDAVTSVARIEQHYVG